MRSPRRQQEHPQEQPAGAAVQASPTVQRSPPPWQQQQQQRPLSCCDVALIRHALVSAAPARWCVVGTRHIWQQTNVMACPGSPSGQLPMVTLLLLLLLVSCPHAACHIHVQGSADPLTSQGSRICR